MNKNTSFVLLALICSAFICAQPVYCAQMDKIAAIVNGDVITENEVSNFMKMTDMAQESGMATNDPIKLRRQLLERMIEDRLILQEAKTMGIKPDEKMIDDRIKEIRSRAGSEKAFEVALKEQGISLSELRDKFRNQFLIYLAVQKEVKSKIQVSPKEVTEYFDTHESDFITPEAVSVDSIFVNDKEQLALVEDALAGGRPFEDVGKEYSQKSALGLVYRGQLKKELEDVLFSLKPGVVSKPFAFEGGFFVFLLNENIKPSKKPIDEVKDEISVKLEDGKTEKILKGWLESLKDKAYISIREV